MISSDNYGNATSYLNEMKQLYYRDEFSFEVENWNRLRSDAVKKAYKEFLFPSAEKELHHKLDSEARDCIALVRDSIHCDVRARLFFVARALQQCFGNVAPYVSDAQRDYGSATKGIRLIK
ncbi:transcription elongation factor SPT6-like [Oscarella lobularis]|uniref:transcription elongation factor SPT6-like n=1 Tax=Oscarella lobularis TaxID=121494 RepID=UPI0033142C40